MVTIKQIITTAGLNVACAPPQDTNYLAPCDHEEADMRMISHLADSVNKGKGLFCTVDTDAVVMSVAAATKYLCRRIVDIALKFAAGKKLRCISVQ